MARELELLFTRASLVDASLVTRHASHVTRTSVDAHVDRASTGRASRRRERTTDARRVCVVIVIPRHGDDDDDDEPSGDGDGIAGVIARDWIRAEWRTNA